MRSKSFHDANASSTRRKRAGYTMLELVCALSILTITAFGVVQLYVSGLKATREAQQEQMASRLMANELDAWRIAARTGLHAEDAAPLRALATVERALEELKGSVRVAPVADGPKGLFQVSVALHWRGAGGRSISRETTALFAAQEVKP